MPAVSPAERLRDDAKNWFGAVGYQIERTWTPSNDSSALLVNVPTRRPGRFDRVAVLCVDGELGLHHLDLLERLTQEENAAEGWGVAQLRISEAARRRAAESDERFSCFSFDELIDLEVDFEPYIAWLQSEVMQRKIDERYIPLSCRKEEIDPITGEPLDISNYHWQNGGLDRYVETWLTDPAKKHLSLLGEFGMGKSWFSLHFASKLAQAWKDAKERGVPRPRVPLVIPLRDYAKQTSVSALLSEFFFNKHKIGLRSYDVFSVLNRMGRLLLIFDGFDEMASRIDRNTMVANFWELAKAVEPGAKVLLSSRTEHFPEAQEARDLFEARVSASPSTIPSDGPTFEIVELVPFDDMQIEKMLEHLLGRDQVESVMANDVVRDLMRRPVMSELVIDALPEIESGAPVNLTRIYLYAIQRKMDRDVTSQRTFTSRADKLLFLSEVAWEMLRTNQLTLNYRDFPERLRACFGSVVESRKDLDYWEQDMRNQGMLVRNAEGDYGPSHKSLLEFLTAYKYAAEMGLLAGDFLDLIPRSNNLNAESYSWSDYFSFRRADGSLPDIRFVAAEKTEKLVEHFGTDDFNPVVYDFLGTMVREHPSFEDILLKHIQSTRGLSHAGSLGGNCANLLGHAQGTLAGVDLEGVDLTGFRRNALTQPRMSLRNAILRGAGLKDVSLAEIDKTGADFTDAALAGSDLLVSSRRAVLSVDHHDGDVSAFVCDDSRDVEVRKILRWVNGDLSSPPTEVKLAETNKEVHAWWRSYGLFEGTSDDWWGYSDGFKSVIISNATGEELYQFDGCATRSIMWGNREALVFQDEPENRGFAWKVLDIRTREVLSESEDIDVEDATSYSYFEDDSALNVWARSSNSTKIYRFGCDQSEWTLIDELPVGNAHSIAEVRHIAKVMADDGHIYLSGHGGKPVIFAREVVEPAISQLIECHQLTFSRGNEFLAIDKEQTIEIWHIKPDSWRKLWTVDFSTRILGVSISEENSRVLVATDSGELVSHSLLSGELLSMMSLNGHLSEAKFSYRSGLSNAELLSLRRAGAVVAGESNDK